MLQPGAAVCPRVAAGSCCLPREKGLFSGHPSPSPGCPGTHPHMLVLRHSTGPRPREQGGTRFLGTPAGHSRNCIRSGRQPPRRSHCPVSCHSGVRAQSCTAWRWFGAPLQGTRALRGRPLPLETGPGMDTHLDWT